MPFEIPLDLNQGRYPNKDVRKKLHGNCEEKEVVLLLLEEKK